MNDDRSPAPKPRVLPPRGLLLALAAQVPAMAFEWPLRPAGWEVAIGVALVLAGVVANVWAERLFRRGGVGVCPFSEAPRVITQGPYRVTRNPMYLGIVLVAGGVAIAMGSWVSLVPVAILAVWLHWRFVLPEEEFLRERLGYAYEEYRRTRPRWLGLPSRGQCAMAAWVGGVGLILSMVASGCSSSGEGGGRATSFRVVDIDPSTPAPMQLAVQACAGLYNRRHGGSVYTRMSDKDARWLDDLHLVPEATVEPASFLDTCLSEFPRCVRYAYGEQQRLLPNVLTVAAVLGAVPLDDGMDLACADEVFDARAEFRDRNTPVAATRYVYENFVDETTGLAMINPGYDSASSQVWDPPLTRDINSALVDFVFSQKLFVTFLVNGCIAPTEEHQLFEEIASTNPWPKPIGVYGYADYWLVFGGYLFEAQTQCVSSRNMGAIPSNVNNLSFFSSRRRPITNPRELERNPAEEVVYDRNDTYVAFVVGDGDNVQYILDARSQWLRDRLAECERDPHLCAPITWSMSPHLPRLAPDVLEWYFSRSRETGRDYFMLPPSGYLYAYPASLSAAVQQSFIDAAEAAATILGTASTVHWEWFTTWQEAESAFLPRYAQHGVIRGIFPVNVPYMFPTFTGWNANQTVKVLADAGGGAVALFRPREWRGVDGSGSGIVAPFYLRPEDMAKELAGYPRGTVAYVYMTSDGGLTLANSISALIPLLPSHVHLVSADTASELALEAAGHAP